MSRFLSSYWLGCEECQEAGQVNLLRLVRCCHILSLCVAQSHVITAALLITFVFSALTPVMQTEKL